MTIDGPAASGKSSVARMVADRLDVPFVSSGLLYRAATFVALEATCDTASADSVLFELNAREVVLVPEEDGDRLLIDGSDMTASLHTDEVDAAVSLVARHPEVREWVNARLREIRPPFVVEGRDMGTAVFSDARHKFYLTAPAEVRARRRLGERTADLASVTSALRRRDQMDAVQLQPAPDAITIDTGNLTLEQVVDRVIERVKETPS